MPTPQREGAGANGLAAASRRLPAHSAEIRQLMEASENFREMCEDLAFAENAVAAIDHLSPPVRERRRTEYEDLIEELVKEIQDALSEAKVMPMPRMPKR